MNPEPTTESLAQGLPQQQARVREIRDVYLSLPGGVGRPAAMLMGASLSRAERAASEGDVVAMAIAYTDLSGYEL